jgi:hypothetical protein
MTPNTLFTPPPNAKGLASVSLENAEVSYWFDEGNPPENKEGMYFLQASIGLKEKLTICILPKNPTEFAKQIRSDYPENKK